MIPLCLVTGFLGSGKTTLLRNIALRYPERALVFLVNEFSTADIDGPVLQSSAKDVLCIPGGSIFCKCLVGEFIRALTELPVRFPQADGVIVEASGMANPNVVEQMLRETRLDAVYVLASIIGLADPGTLPVLVQTLPNIRAQLESSDVVLLNKIDLFSEQEIDHAEEVIHSIKPDAPVIRTRFCEGIIEPFTLHAQRQLNGEYALCRDPNYAAFSVRLEHTINEAYLLEALAHLPGLYRAKGFIPGEHGPVFVDVTCANASTHDAPDYTGPCELALIVHRAVEQEAQRFMAALVTGSVLLIPA